MASSSPCLHLLCTRNRFAWKRLLFGNCVTCCAVVPTWKRGEGRTRGGCVICRCTLVVVAAMLYACAASFSRAVIDHRLHDDWSRESLSTRCDPGSRARNCFHHCDCSREPLSKGYCLRSQSVPATGGVLSEASDVPVKLFLWWSKVIVVDKSQYHSLTLNPISAPYLQPRLNPRSRIQ